MPLGSAPVRNCIGGRTDASAFSRRIRALETWLGVVLVDRATQPMVPTEAGRRFLETAEETVRQLYASRQELQAASLLGRMTAYAQGRGDAPPANATHTNDSAVALKFMVLEGHGFAWLPRSLGDAGIVSGAFLPIASEIVMEVRLYRNRRRRRAVIETVWPAAAATPVGRSPH